MLALLVSACLAQEFGPPRIVTPFPRSVGVMVPTGRADVEAFDGGFFIAWADGRRLTNLARTPITGGADVWVKVVPPGLLGTTLPQAQLVCPGAGLTAGPRLAVSSTGVLGVAWADARGVALARVDQNGAWLDGPCGQLVWNGSTTLVEVSPRGPGYAVVFNGPSALQWSNVVGTTISQPMQRLVSPQSTVVTLGGPSNGTVIGWLANQTLTVDSVGGPMVVVPGVDAFDLVEGTPGPASVLVRDGGLFLGATPSTTRFIGPASARRPFGVAVDGGVLALMASNAGNSRLVNDFSGGITSLGRSGLPEGLAVTRDDGIALLSAPSGVLSAIRVSGVDFQGAAVAVSLAGVQRRPTLAWSAPDQAWELVWEEGLSSFSSRHATIRLDGGMVSAGELFIDGGWPRVFPQFDGGLGYMALEEQGTTFSLPRGVVTVPVEQLDASVEAVVAGEPGAFGWTGPSTPSGFHQEFTLRSAELPREAFLPDEVTCATWFGGSYYVTRRGDAGATIAAFPDDSPPVAGEAMRGQLACVAARLEGSPALAMALVDRLGLKVSTLDAGWRVPFDAGVRDLQMTSVANRWLVVWDTEDALSAALFSDFEAPRLLMPIDTRPQTHRGVPSLATSPAGAAAVAWPVLEGDSVELRVRVLAFGTAVAVDGGVIVPVDDAGVVMDGGVAPVDDGGVAPVDDGGVAPVGDGGVRADGGSGGPAVPVEVTFVPVCGCSSVGDGLWLLVALVFVRRRRAPVMQ